MTIPPFYTFSHFHLKNDNETDTVYPMIYDITGTRVIWDGSTDTKNEVAPSKYIPSA